MPEPIRTMAKSSGKGILQRTLKKVEARNDKHGRDYGDERCRGVRRNQEHKKYDECDAAQEPAASSGFLEVPLHQKTQRHSSAGMIFMDKNASNRPAFTYRSENRVRRDDRETDTANRDQTIGPSEKPKLLREGQSDRSDDTEEYRTSYRDCAAENDVWRFRPKDGEEPENDDGDDCGIATQGRDGPPEM